MSVRELKEQCNLLTKYHYFLKTNVHLVISGGVACNNLLAKALSIVCSELGYKFIRTPPKLCTDKLE